MSRRHLLPRLNHDLHAIAATLLDGVEVLVPHRARDSHWLISTQVDAHKAVKDVTQVFYEEDRQVLLTEVEKGFELRPESTRRLLDGVAITRLTG